MGIVYLGKTLDLKSREANFEGCYPSHDIYNLELYMKFISSIKKIENIYIRKSKKVLNYKKMVRGDLISMVYSDIDKENIKLLNFIGFCKKYRSKGINTKLSARIFVRRVYAELEFFLYSKFLADAGVVRKVRKNFERSTSKYKSFKNVKIKKN